MQAADATAAAARAGLDLEIVFAKNNSRLQIEQLYHYVHARDAKPLAFVVQTVSGDGLPNVARDAAKAGIGWVLLNRDAPYVDDLRAAHPALPVGLVTIDQLGIGRIQGRQFRKLLPRGGRVLYIQGPPDTPAAKLRLQGAEEELRGTAIEMKILQADWTEAGSERAVKMWLDLSSTRDYVLDLAGAQNDAMACGARKAIGAARPEWLQRPFTGCDGLVEGGQKLVHDKQLAATVILPPTAGAAIQLIASHARTRTAQARTVLEPRPYPSAL